MNIIICGAGRVGFTIAKLLSEQNHSITMIDQSSDDIQKINEALDDLAGTEPEASTRAVKNQIKSAQSLIDKAKDNIAYVLGLPAAITGAFGFLWDSSSDEAALQYQVDQLEVAVADLKAENDLLGGGTKNWSLNPADAPGGL